MRWIFILLFLLLSSVCRARGSQQTDPKPTVWAISLRATIGKQYHDYYLNMRGPTAEFTACREIYFNDRKLFLAFGAGFTLSQATGSRLYWGYPLKSESREYNFLPILAGGLALTEVSKSPLYFTFRYSHNFAYYKLTRSIDGNIERNGYTRSSKRNYGEMCLQWRVNRNFGVEAGYGVTETYGVSDFSIKNFLFGLNYRWR